MGCRVVWTDACVGRIGYVCTLAQGPTIHELFQSGAGSSSESKPLPAVTGETKLR